MLALGSFARAAKPTARRLITDTLRPALCGDSITLQHTTGTTNFNSIGFMSMLNYLTCNRYPFNIADNYGGGGQNTQAMDARKATDLGGKNYNFVSHMSGTNDVPATTTLADMKTYTQSLLNYYDANNMYVLLHTLLPRTQDNGVPLTSDMLTKLLSFNDWLLAKDNRRTVFVPNHFARMTTNGTDPNPLFFKNESGKLLHPSPEGSWEIGRSLSETLTPIFGIGTHPASGNNIISGVSILAGTAGILGANASGIIATGWTASGSGGTNGRLFSKNPDGSQRQSVSLPDGAGAAASTILEVTTDPTTGYAVGDTLYGWLDIEMHSGANSDGPWLECRDYAGTTLNYIGLNKAGSTTGFLPLNKMGRGLITTPKFTVRSGNTKLEYLVRHQAYAVGAASTAEFTVYGAGIRNLSMG